MSIYIIAEIGNTHEGSVGLAKCFIKAAADCGVDAVKFQTHIFEAESLPNAPNPPYFSDENRQDYFNRTSFNLNQYRILKDYSERLGVDFMSSPFSIEAVDLLEELNISTYKIPSGEVSNPLLLKKVARTGKKVLLSSGMSTWEELDEAINTLQSNGCQDLVILQCTSEYPCAPELAGIHLLKDYKEKYNLPVGFSDHTLGISVPICAVANGACIIEKHFTLSKKMYGSDAKNSCEPEEFKLLVNSIRETEKALTSKVDKDKEAIKLKGMKAVFEKSVVSKIDIPINTVITEEMLTVKKPGTGISALKMHTVSDRVSKRHIPKNTMISIDDFE